LFFTQMRAVAALRSNGVRGRIAPTQRGALALVECGAHGLHVHEFGDQTRCDKRKPALDPSAWAAPWKLALDPSAWGSALKVGA
jgi:hypothetical protein